MLGGHATRKVVGKREEILGVPLEYQAYVVPLVPVVKHGDYVGMVQPLQDPNLAVQVLHHLDLAAGNLPDHLHGHLGHVRLPKSRPTVGSAEWQVGAWAFLSIERGEHKRGCGCWRSYGCGSRCGHRCRRVWA